MRVLNARAMAIFSLLSVAAVVALLVALANGVDRGSSKKKNVWPAQAAYGRTGALGGKGSSGRSTVDGTGAPVVLTRSNPAHGSTGWRSAIASGGIAVGSSRGNGVGSGGNGGGGGRTPGRTRAIAGARGFGGNALGGNGGIAIVMRANRAGHRAATAMADASGGCVIGGQGGEGGTGGNGGTGGSGEHGGNAVGGNGGSAMTITENGAPGSTEVAVADASGGCAIGGQGGNGGSAGGAAGGNGGSGGPGGDSVGGGCRAPTPGTPGMSGLPGSAGYPGVPGSGAHGGAWGNAVSGNC